MDIKLDVAKWLWMKTPLVPFSIRPVSKIVSLQILMGCLTRAYR
nr:hypothetical protein [Delftia acidovorans]